MLIHPINETRARRVRRTLWSLSAYPLALTFTTRT